MHHCMFSPIPGRLAALERYFLEKLPPALLATRWMGEFVSNIYGGTRRNNDMYIIWASALSEGAEGARPNSSICQCRPGGPPVILLLLYFLVHFNNLRSFL